MIDSIEMNAGSIPAVPIIPPVISNAVPETAFSFHHPVITIHIDSKKSCYIQSQRGCDWGYL